MLVFHLTSSADFGSFVEREACKHFHANVILLRAGGLQAL
jgi:hypothetical protein